MALSANFYCWAGWMPPELVKLRLCLSRCWLWSTEIDFCFEWCVFWPWCFEMSSSPREACAPRTLTCRHGIVLSIALLLLELLGPCEDFSNCLLQVEFIMACLLLTFLAVYLATPVVAVLRSSMCIGRSFSGWLWSSRIGFAGWPILFNFSCLSRNGTLGENPLLPVARLNY